MMASRGWSKVATPSKRFLNEELISRGLNICLRPRIVIITQENLADKVFYLKTGVIKIYFVSAEGSEKTVIYVEEGNFFGDAGVLRQKNYGITATTVTACDLVVFSENQFCQFMRENADFAEACMYSMAEKIWATGRQVNNLAFETGYGRVVSALAYVARYAGIQVKGAGKLSVAINQQELAEMAGVSRVTVSATLKELQRSNIIATGRNEIFIQDLDRLKKLHPD